MFCDLCNIDLNIYYFKKHTNTIKHIEKLNMLKNKVTLNEFNEYLQKQEGKGKIPKKKTEKLILIKKGKFKIFF